MDGQKKLSLKEIAQQLAEAQAEERRRLLELYAADERAGVQKLVQKYYHEQEKLEKELARIENMKSYERQYADCMWIGGVDEVGRGPLAGPVVTCALMLPKDCTILYINDSKQLSAQKREVLYEEIIEKAVDYRIGMVSAERIDEINILQATYEAMRQAITQLTPAPDIMLNDAVTIPRLSIPQCPIIKGDAKSQTIAAASIVAKVTRDRMMEEYDRLYPGYGFAKNKGYGSSEHIHALKELGPCPIHRRSFIKNLWR